VHYLQRVTRSYFFKKKIKNERQQKGKEGIKRQAKKISFLQ